MRRERRTGHDSRGRPIAVDDPHPDQQVSNVVGSGVEVGSEGLLIGRRGGEDQWSPDPVDALRYLIDSQNYGRYPFSRRGVPCTPTFEECSQPQSHYVMIDDVPHRELDLLYWAQEFNKNRQLRRTTVGDAVISTVFLALDHSISEDGPPILWETMVFDRRGEVEHQVRASSLEEAIQNHTEILTERLRAERRETVAEQTSKLPESVVLKSRPVRKIRFMEDEA